MNLFFIETIFFKYSIVFVRIKKKKFLHTFQTILRNFLWLCPNEEYADPPPLSFDPTFKKDAQWAETKEKQFSDFYFSSYRENSSIVDNF